MRRYAIGFAILTAAAVFFFTQDLSRALYWDDPTPWWRYLVSWILGTWALGLAIPVVVALSLRIPLERGTWPRALVVHLVASAGFAIVLLVAIAALHTATGFVGPIPTTSFRTTFAILAILSTHNYIVAYWTIVAAVHGYRYYRSYQERRLHATRLESQLVRAQLATLKMQLQPHFLFNTLNAIMVLVRQQRSDQAEATLAQLSDLLRCVLDDVEAQEVPLRRELEYVRLYLAIEQMRFQDRLQVEIEVDAAALDANVPHMGLQPLVENAIRHGICASATASKIAIHGTRVDESLELTVLDDGPGIMPRSTPGRGIGLANVRARLEQLYGAGAKLVVQNGAAAGAKVTMIVPYRVAPVEEVHARADR